MKKMIILFLAIFLFGYDAKVEPFDEYNIKSSVAGEVIKVNKDLEAKNLNNDLIVKIDDKQDIIKLNQLQNSLTILKDEIDNQKEIVKRKKEIYERYKTLKTKSKTEKDLKFFDYINAKNQLLNLQNQYQTTLSNIKSIKDTINKKNIKAKGYLYKIYVNKGDYVAPGMLVAKVYDISKEKLVIFVPIDEKVEGKSVYINGKKSNFKIYKVWKLPDDRYITSKRVELVGEGLRFGDIVKVELK